MGSSLLALGVDNWVQEKTNSDGSSNLGYLPALAETVSGHTLTVTFDGDVILYEKEDAVQQLKKISCVLITLFDDLETVTWQYSFDGQKDTLCFNISDAASMLGPENDGSRIKEYGKTAGGLQKVINAISFESGVFIG